MLDFASATREILKYTGIVVVSWVGGLLTKPLQEEVSRPIRLRHERRTARRDIYKELAWNIRLIMMDNWLKHHAIAASDVRTEAYERAKASGVINEFDECSELMEALEFFKSIRGLGLAGGTSLDKIAEICGEYLFGLEYAIRNGRISKDFLRKVSSTREREHIDQFLSAMEDLRKGDESGAKQYLERRRRQVSNPPPPDLSI